MFFSVFTSKIDNQARALLEGAYILDISYLHYSILEDCYIVLDQGLFSYLQVCLRVAILV